MLPSENFIAATKANSIEKKEETLKSDLKPQLPKISVISQVLTDMDFVKNTKNILYSKRVDAATQAFDVVRAICVFWIVWGHNYTIRFVEINKFKIDTKLFEQTGASWVKGWLENGYYAVDLFLYMGGFVSILAMARFYTDFRNAPYWKYPVLYLFLCLKRYIRIMPAYALLNWFTLKVVPNMLANGPLALAQLNCTYDKMISSLFLWAYNGDFNKPICAGWCWYLAVDYQLFMTVPIIMAVHAYNKKIGLIFTSCLVLGSTIATFVYCVMNDIRFMNYDNQDMMYKYYAKFYFRGNVYW